MSSREQSPAAASPLAGGGQESGLARRGGPPAEIEDSISTWVWRTRSDQFCSRFPGAGSPPPLACMAASTRRALTAMSISNSTHVLSPSTAAQLLYNKRGRPWRAAHCRHSWCWPQRYAAPFVLPWLRRMVSAITVGSEEVAMVGLCSLPPPLAAGRRRHCEHSFHPPICIIAAKLLAQRDAIDNWADFSEANGLSGWSDGTPVCEWSGIACSASGAVTEL